MTSNGSVNPTGLFSKLLIASAGGTQQQPCLPVFASMNHARPTDRPASACERLQRWDHLPTDRVIRNGKAAAKADAVCGMGPLGNLALTLFIAASIGMAMAAIHQEERLAPQERQLLHQQR